MLNNKVTNALILNSNKASVTSTSNVVDSSDTSDTSEGSEATVKSDIENVSKLPTINKDDVSDSSASSDATAATLKSEMESASDITEAIALSDVSLVSESTESVITQKDSASKQILDFENNNVENDIFIKPKSNLNNFTTTPKTTLDQNDFKTTISLTLGNNLIKV